MSIAQDIVDGDICEVCCCPDGNGPRGYPFTCRECGGPKYQPGYPDPTYRKPKSTSPKVACKICGCKVHEIGMHQHLRDSHQI